MTSTPAPSELQLVAAALERLRPDVDAVLGPDGAARLRAADWAAGGVEESGQFHRVLVLPGVAVLRMARLHEAGAAPDAVWEPHRSPAALLPRRMALLEALADAGLPFGVPAPLSEVLTVHDDAGAPVGACVLQAFVPGTAHPPHEGDPAALRSVVDALDAVDVTAPDLAPHLGGPFDFRGPWSAARTAGLAALPDVLPAEHAAALPADWPGVVAAITQTATAWAAAPPDGPSLVHADLAGHNMHWLPAPTEPAAAGPVGWRLAGVLDWDLAHAGDAARNVAYLGLWHGEGLVGAIARTPAEASRARVWLGAAALDALDDARARQELTGRAPRWGRLLRKVLPRVERAAGQI